MNWHDVVFFFVFSGLGLLVTWIMIIVVAVLASQPDVPNCDDLRRLGQENLDRRIELVSDGLEDTSEYTVLELEYEKLRTERNCLA